VDPAGKVAIVTGAGTGIGKATAAQLVAAGAKVACVDISAATASATAAALGAGAIGVQADVSQPADVRRMFDETEAAFGPVDIVHNNAGLIGGEPLWPESPLEKVAAVIAVNLGGVAMGTEEAIRRMRRRGGVVVNTASVAGLAPMPTDPVYSATKVGVLRIVESCAGFAQSDGIRVNAVLPGMVDTDMTNRHTGDGTKPAEWLQPIIAATTMLTPDDIAAAVLDIIRDDAKVAEQVIVRTQNAGSWRGPGRDVDDQAPRAARWACAKGTSLSTRGSAGRPSTRSPMMLRWISSEPPAMR
jgi:NAD(P)-dependent dehydrogenase (short-subunit alcohol dehydrogenase family)